ncbi:MAG: hypothetical protein ACKVX7_20720 [Planctomycetota bacterium]
MRMTRLFFVLSSLMLMSYEAAPCGAQNILFLDMNNGTAATDALNAQGLTFTVVTLDAEFNAELTSGTQWDLVLVANSCCGFATVNLVNYINNGGKAIVSYWNLDADAALSAALDVSATTSFSAPLAIASWNPTGTVYSLWSQPIAVASLTLNGTNPWVDDGDRLTVGAGGFPVGGFTPTPAVAEAGIVIGNQGRTICIGHEFDSLVQDRIRDFLRNCLAFLLNKRVLAYNDSAGFTTASWDALDDEGHVYTTVTSGAAFNAALTSGIDWDLVVVEVANLAFTSTDLVAYIDAGGRALVTYWTLDTDAALQAALGVGGAVDFTTPLPIFEWPATWPHDAIWTTPNVLPATITTEADLAADNGDRLTVVDGIAVAGFTGSPTIGQAAVVVKTGGNTICIGEDFISLALVDSTNLMQNCIHYLCEPPRKILYFNYNTVATASRDALDAENLPYFLTENDFDFNLALASGVDWDYVLVDNPSNTMSSVRLIDYVNSGGKALLSYWDLDTDVDLQDAFRVTSAIDFFDPMALSDWGALTSVWSVPNVVTGIAAGTSIWIDNGDRLTVGDAKPVGGFTPAPVVGQAAVAIASGSDTICIGHEFDGLDQSSITDFLQNCIRLQCPPPPENDDCADAFAINEGTFFGTLIGATNDGTASCGASATNPDIWYSYTAAMAGVVTVSTCGTHDQYGLDDGVDTVLALFNSCGGAQLGCDDDEPMACGALSTGLNRDSLLVRNVGAGETLRIRVSKFSSDRVGPIVLNLSFAVAPPANDDCADSILVGVGTHPGTLVGATNDDSASCGASATNADVWYRFTTAVAGTLHADTCGSAPLGTPDTVLAMFAACGGAELACNDNGLFCPGSLSAINLAVSAGSTTLIRVSHAGASAADDFQLNISFVGSAPSFRRADANGDGALNIADPAYTLNFLFVPGSPAHPCQDSGDSNDSGAIDIADAVYSLNWLFVAGSPPPPAPFPGCGIDPTADASGCASYPTCP